MNRCPTMVKEVAHLDVALKFVNTFRTAVDGGAHVGLWAAKMAERFDRVVAFEPHAPHADLCAEIPGIEVHTTALGNRRELMGLAAGPHNDGQMHLTHRGGSASYVDVRPLDAYALSDVDLLKLDVEGYEYFALMGAAQTIYSSWPVIVIERNELCRRYGIRPGHASNWLTENGYRCVDRMNKDEVWIPS